jgi:hypothetical protein
MMQSYQLKDVLRIIDIPRERFNEWSARGFVNASIENQKGSRIFKEYTIEDIYSICVFRHLIEECSVSRESASTAISIWKTHLKENPDDLKNGILFLVVSKFDTDKQTENKREMRIMPFSLPNWNTSDNRYVRLMKFTMQLMQTEDEEKHGEWSHILIVNIKNILDGIDTRL